MKTAVVYWSGTGNTEAMAKAVAEGMTAAGAEAVLLTPDKVQPGDLNADASNRTDRRDPPADLENSKTEAAKLPQTGQLWWPVWLLTAVGVLMLTGGLAARKRYVGKREK